MSERNDDARAARLKAALRENLKRRKVQVRGREADAPPQPPGDAGAPSAEPDAPTAGEGQRG